MSGTLASLRDWLIDQVREVQQLTPLAVSEPLSAPSHQTSPRRPTASTSAPASIKPVAVPSIEDMPSIDTELICESERVDADWPACEGVPTAVARLAHAEARCEPTAFLLCGVCLARVVAGARESAPALHLTCGTYVQSWNELVIEVTPL